MPSPPEFALECGGRTVVARVRVARGFFGRALGLMGRRSLPTGEGLWLSPCAAIHTGFMRFPIDAIFLDRDGGVVRVALAVRPWRVCRGAGTAASVVEVRSGWLDATALAAGARVRFVPLNSAVAAVPGR